MAERVEKIELDLYRTEPENPGAIIRLDRVERLLSTLLKGGGALLGIGVLYKAFEVIGAVIENAVTP